MISNIPKPKTQLERDLYSQVQNVISDHDFMPYYYPQRVEPLSRSSLNDYQNWSKFAGKTLFINEELLDIKYIRKPLMLRETFLLYIKLNKRNCWWVQALANTFPLVFSIQQKAQEKWELLRQEVEKHSTELLDSLELIASTCGQEGIFEVLKTASYTTLRKKEQYNRKTKTKVTRKLSLKEFYAILHKIRSDYLRLNDLSIDILKIALIRQTTKLKELAQFISKHKSTISKNINNLLNQKILYERFALNKEKFGLVSYTTFASIKPKYISFFTSHFPSNPFLYSQKIYRFYQPFFTQHYVAPNSNEFRQLLHDSYSKLNNEEKISNYHIFQIKNPHRIYNLSLYDQKKNQTKIQLFDHSIKTDLFKINLAEKDYLDKTSEIIDLPLPAFKKTILKLSELDFGIINQFLRGQTKRRKIQQNLQKDMNSIIERIHLLRENNILYRQVNAILPDCLNHLAFFIELNAESKLQNKNNSILKQRLHNLCYCLPHAYFASIEGSFTGLTIQTYLPKSGVIEFLDFLNWFLPESNRRISILGNAISTYFPRKILYKRWLGKGQWITNPNDFEYKKKD
ncbi:MAG: hypothetical protein U9O98_02850 [Asgard group archaeon]|nr:hypothetical protein [Asgard group archaeon]